MRISQGNGRHMNGSRLGRAKDNGQKLRDRVETAQTHLRIRAHSPQWHQNGVQESQGQYALQYEHSPIGYVTFDEAAEIRNINPAGARLIRREGERLIRTSFPSLLCRGSLKQFAKHLGRCRTAKEEQVISEVRLLKRGGESVAVQLITVVFYNKEERLYQTALIDLTEQKQNERALAEAKEFAESVVDTVREPLIVLDKNLKVVSINRAFTETFRKSARTVRSRQFDVLLNLWWSGNKVRDELENVLLKNTTLENYELEIESKELGKRILLLNARRIYQRANLPPQILVAVKDITEEKAAVQKLKENEAMLAEAQRLARIGSWEWDIGKNHITWSEELYRIFGISRIDFKENYESLLECVHRDDRLTFDGIIRDVYRSGGSFDFFHRTGCSENTRILHCRGYVPSDATGKALKIVGTMQDITERKEAEERLHQLNIQLEERVGARTEALQQSYQQMEAFCYSIAHDLRAPLRAMKGFGHALFEDYADAFDAEGKEYLDRIVTAADRMDLLIHDLLDYGRLNTIDLPIARVDADEILTKVLSYLELASEVIKSEKLPVVYGHKVVLELALRNLIDNALKFMAPGVSPHIRIWGAEIGNMLRITVQDNGIGIAPEHRERIFQVFQRLHSDVAYPGTGIGLAIVAKGIERVGGRVGVESELGQGSSFWIELPKA